MEIRRQRDNQLQQLTVPVVPCLKGLLLLALFLWSAQADDKVLNDISQDPTWQALLHFNGQRHLIADPNFYLSQPSNVIELQQSIALFFDSPTSATPAAICRFPARYEWLRQKLGYAEHPTAASLCPDYAEFLSRVPADAISLIYAAENITQPSSMMGHSFLAIRGANANGQALAHAVTFFTDVDLSRPIDLIWGSLVRGQSGYFLLSPLRQQLTFYLHDEQRNVYEYPITTNHQQRQLLLAHLWELRQIQMDYYFHRFNCATLTNHMLALIAPTLREASRAWLSPLDTVKLTAQAGILQTPILYPSDKWKIRALHQQVTERGLSPRLASIAQGEDTGDDLENNDRFLLAELGKSLASYRFHQGQWSQQQFTAWSDSFNRLQSTETTLRLELPASRDPLHRSKDSQLSVGIDHNHRLQLRWLPAAHQITDNHRHAMLESELQLFGISASYHAKTHSIRLEDAVLYSVASFIPYDRLTGGLSGRFQIRGYRPVDATGRQAFTAHIGGGLGKSYALHPDLLGYVVLHAAIEQRRGFYVSGGPEVGLIMYQLFNNKSIVSLRKVSNHLGSGHSGWSAQWQHSWFAHRDFSIQASYAAHWHRGQTSSSAMIEARFYF